MLIILNMYELVFSARILKFATACQPGAGKIPGLQKNSPQPTGICDYVPSCKFQKSEAMEFSGWRLMLNYHPSLSKPGRAKNNRFARRKAKVYSFCFGRVGAPRAFSNSKKLRTTSKRSVRRDSTSWLSRSMA